MESMEAFALISGKVEEEVLIRNAFLAAGRSEKVALISWPQKL